MTLRRILLTVGGLVAAGVFGWLLMSALDRTLSAPATPGADTIVDEAPVAVAPPPPDVPATGPRIKATLYFASADGQRLVGVEQEVPLAETPVAQARAIVMALLATRPDESLSSTIPEGTTLRGVYVSARNEVFVDLDETVRTGHPGGSMQELLTVYSLVNSVLVNLPTMTEVQILIDGREADTLAGHVDLRRPLRKNEGLILSPIQSQ